MTKIMTKIMTKKYKNKNFFKLNKNLKKFKKI